MDNLLEQIKQLHNVPQGAYSIRENGKSKINSTEQIKIVANNTKNGINVYVKKGTKNKSLHIPVIVSQGGFEELVYNNFYIEDNCEVTIVGSCGIHNNSSQPSQHNGVHTFHVGKNCTINYYEKHLAIGDTKNSLNPITKIFVKENSVFNIETHQLGGVKKSKRTTYATLYNNAKLNIIEKILTDKDDTAKTNFKVRLKGVDSSVHVTSRSVAKDNSCQEFTSTVVGDNKCYGRIECDGICINNAKLISTPKVVCNHTDATLTHEASIGKIAGEQLVKLMTLGLDKNQAEDMIIKGFLK